jgi:ankyrin repeat protein
MSGWKRLSREDISDTECRRLVQEAISNGSVLDVPIDKEGDTMLHLSVIKDLHDCVSRLLSAGANSRELNFMNVTPIDLALDGGNQALLQLFNRREEYKRHAFSMSPVNLPNLSSNDELSCFTTGIIYQDYCDWTDTERGRRLQVSEYFDIFISRRYSFLLF